MKKIRYILLVILLLFCINVKAEDNCDSKEYNRLKELAKKIEFDYDYELVNGKAVFAINAVNLNSELKVLIIEDYYTDNYKEFKDNSNHIATLNNFEEGSKVVVTIKAFVPNWCSGKTILTKTVKLPYYNYVYNEEKCKGHEDFKYCKLLIDKSLTQEQFDKQYQEYLDNGKTDVKPENPTKEDNTKLYMIIGAGVLAVILTIVLVSSIIKRRKKNSL